MGNFMNFKLFKSKKANVFQIALIAVALVVVAFTVVLTTYIINSFYTEWNASIDETPAMIEAQEGIENAMATWDYGVILLMIVLTVGIIISSFLIPTHPIFMVLNFIGIFILVFLAMIFNNVYGEFIAGGDAMLYTTASQYPMMNYLISYLPYIVAIIMFVVTIVTYTRTSQGSSGGY
jgi:hypothetical protein